MSILSKYCTLILIDKRKVFTWEGLIIYSMSLRLHCLIFFLLLSFFIYIYSGDHLLLERKFFCCFWGSRLVKPLILQVNNLLNWVCLALKLLYGLLKLSKQCRDIMVDVFLISVNILVVTLIQGHDNIPLWLHLY